MVAAGRRRSATETAHDLATRLGGITQRLHATGAGVAMPVDAQRLCEIVHAAYNPRAAELLEEARAAGEPARAALGRRRARRPRTPARELLARRGRVGDVGDESQAPRGEVRENVLARLIAPHGDIARKRVTLLYRVIDPGEAARIVERDLHNAEFRVNSAARPTARAVVEQQAARATAQEEARGAALVNFGMLVTDHRPRGGAAAAPPGRRWRISRRRPGSTCGRCGARRTRRSPRRCRSGCSCPRI